MQTICTVGPSFNTPEMLKKLRDAGMSIVRFNFSHPDFESMSALTAYARSNCPGLLLLQDLQGVKLRIGQDFLDSVPVKPGDRLVFCSENFYGKLRASLPNNLVLPVHFDGDFRALKVAHSILMKDATMRFDVVRCAELESELMLQAVVVRGGIIRARKALNVPEIDRSNLSLTSKDKKDIEWGIRHELDIICLSFVCNVNQVKELKTFIKSRAKALGKPGYFPKIWVKIETRQGVENFDGIKRVVDGIILARGDLGPEVGIYEVPEIQTMLLKKMRSGKTPFFVATQVLQSMIRDAVPQRAELNDIYFCLSENVTGFMLGEETAIGKFPVESVETLAAMSKRFLAAR